jgi:hypothetical protein
MKPVFVGIWLIACISMASAVGVVAVKRCLEPIGRIDSVNHSGAQPPNER